MKISEARIRRVEKNEERFDRISESVRRLSEALDEFEKIQPEIDGLEKYYTGGQWLKDFEADEAGLFPKDMKRGVLSEDGPGNLLNEINEIRQRCAKLK